MRRSLARWLTVRLAQGAVTVLGVLAITFAVLHLIPADPAALIAGERATPAQVEALRHEMGFDRPLPEQFLAYVRRAVIGDFGRSLFTKRPIAADLAERLPATLELTGVALMLTVVLGVPLGVVAAVRRNGWLDQVLRVFTVSGLAIASFWFGILLQLLFAMRLEWLPLGGRIDGFPPEGWTGLYLVDAVTSGDGEALSSALSHIALPAVTLAFPAIATVVRFTRAGVLDVLGRPYVEYQRAMGLPPGLILWKYVLRNALTSTVTQVGLLAGVLLGGAVVVEAIFDWPGLGTYAVNAILLSDYNAILGVTLWVAAAYVLINIGVDLVHRAIDPRLAAAG